MIHCWIFGQSVYRNCVKFSFSLQCGFSATSVFYYTRGIIKCNDIFSLTFFSSMEPQCATTWQYTPFQLYSIGMNNGGNTRYSESITTRKICSLFVPQCATVWLLNNTYLLQSFTPRGPLPKIQDSSTMVSVRVV